MPKKILIAGYFGFGNTGDEAILAATLQNLRRLQPDLEFCVVSGNPDNTKKLHEVSSILWTDLPAIIQNARECDLMLLGGGGIFNDYWGENPATLLTKDHGGITFYGGFPVLANLLEKPLMLYSVGVGPVITESGKDLTRLSFEFGNVATIRDVESLDVLKSLGIPVENIQVTADEAFNLSVDEHRSRQVFLEAQISQADPVVGVCLRNWDLDGESKWQRPVSAALDKFIEEKDCTVVFIPFQNDLTSQLTNDLSAAKEVYAGMVHSDKALILSGDYPPDVMAGITAQCDLIVGMRLHSLIFAAMSGIPSVALIYDPKVASLMSQLELGEYAIDLATLKDERLLATMDAAWKNRQQIRNGLLIRTEKIKRLAEENARLAISLLADTDSRTDNKTRKIKFIDEFAVKQTLLLAERDAQLKTKVEEVNEKQRAIQEFSTRLTDIYNSNAWAINTFLWRLRLLMAPSESKRERILKQGLRMLGTGDKSASAGQFKNLKKSGSALMKIVSKYSKARVVVFIPSIPWDVDLFQRPQQLAAALAHQGCLVFYCEPSYSRQEPGFHQIRERLYMCHIPMQVFTLLVDPTVIALSYNKDYLQYFRDPCVVYDYIDELDIFPYDLQKLKQDHIELCKMASVVMATSDRLYKQISALNPKAILCPNGVDFDHFELARNKNIEAVVPDEMQTILARGKPIIGYYGALADWFDYELFEFAAKKCPDLSFVLIGPDYDGSLPKSKILQLPNMYWLGVRPYSELPKYIRFFDIATIPFKLNEITHSTSPLKLFEFTASRKPVVITALHESMRYSGGLIANNAEEYVKKLREGLVLGNDPTYQAQAEKFALDNTWDIRAKQILQALGPIP
jgi:polysaccharide pyruvyl transferase CsaB